MAVDPRIEKYLQALEAIKDANFSMDIPVSGDGPGKLGSAIADLRRHLAVNIELERTLAEVAQKINEGLLLDEVLDFVYANFRRIIPYDRIGIALLEDDGSIVKSLWANSEAALIRIPKGYAAALAGSSLEMIIASGEPRILNDLELHLREHPGSDSTRRIVEEGMRSSLTCPLQAMNRAIGLIFFSSMRTDTYRNVHVDVYRRIAGQLSVIIEKSRLYQKLIEVNALKDRFLGIAAHDLRSPLGVGKNFLALFLQGYLGEIPDEQLKILRTIDRNLDRMLQMINDLLDISTIESGQLELKPQRIDLSLYLQKAVELRRPLAQAKSISLQLELPPELPEVSMDPQRIDQVLDNLVTNAIKFSFAGTQIILSARKTGNFVSIEVKDQGQGIPQQDLLKLFSDFGKTSVKPTSGEKSTGLGLAIVKRIVEAHEGQVGAESETGKGSTFYFTLPV